MVAYAFVAYDDSNPSDDISEYGQLQAFYKNWGDPGTVGTSFSSLNTRSCTMEELGLEGDTSKFWPLSESTRNELEYYKDKMQCID